MCSTIVWKKCDVQRYGDRDNSMISTKGTQSILNVELYMMRYVTLNELLKRIFTQEMLF